MPLRDHLAGLSAAAAAALAIAGIATNEATSKALLALGVAFASASGAAARLRASLLKEEIKRQQQVAEDVKVIRKIEDIEKQLLKKGEEAQQEIKRSLSEQLEAIEGLRTEPLHDRELMEQRLSKVTTEVKHSIAETIQQTVSKKLDEIETKLLHHRQVTERILLK